MGPKPRSNLRGGTSKITPDRRIDLAHDEWSNSRQTASETRLPCRFRPVVVHTPCHKRIKLLQSCGRSFPHPPSAPMQHAAVQCRAARPGGSTSPAPKPRSASPPQCTSTGDTLRKRPAKTLRKRPKRSGPCRPPGGPNYASLKSRA